jgi:trigger factor
VQVQDLPAADDEFAQLASEFDTIDELRADLRRELEQNGRIEQANAARDAVLEALIARVDAEVPEGVLQTEVDSRREQINNQLAQAGLTLERYLEESAEEDEPKDVESFWADTEKRAGDALKAQMILDKIADDREVGVEQNELTQFIVRRAQATGVTPDQELQHMLEHNHVAEYMGEIRRSKVLDMILSEATVTDSSGQKVDLANLQGDGSLLDPAAAAAEADADVTNGEGSPEDADAQGTGTEAGEQSEDANA